MNFYRVPNFVWPQWLHDGAIVRLKRDLEEADRGTLGIAEVFPGLISVLFKHKDSPRGYPRYWEILYEPNKYYLIHLDWEANNFEMGEWRKWFTRSV